MAIALTKPQYKAAESVTTQSEAAVVETGNLIEGLPSPTVTRLIITDTGGETAAQFEADGTLVFEGDATCWEDLRISADSGTRPTSDPPQHKAFGPSGNILGWAFEAAGMDQVFFAVQMPHSWKAGSTIYPHVHWSPATTDTGNVTWKLEYTWANINGTFGAPATITATDAGDGTAWKHQLIAFESNAGIVATGKTISSMLMCRLYRDAPTDTFTGDAFLLELDFHYETDMLGSRTETAK